MVFDKEICHKNVLYHFFTLNFLLNYFAKNYVQWFFTYVSFFRFFISILEQSTSAQSIYFLVSLNVCLFVFMFVVISRFRITVCGRQYLNMSVKYHAYGT